MYVSVGLTSPRTVLPRPLSPDPKGEELRTILVRRQELFTQRSNVTSHKTELQQNLPSEPQISYNTNICSAPQQIATACHHIL